MGSIDDLIQRYLDGTVSEKDRSELLKLIRSGYIETAMHNKIAQTLMDDMRAHDTPDSETRAKGEEIFKLIIQPKITSSEVTSRKSQQSHHLKPVFESYRRTFRYAAAFLLFGAAGLLVYPWQKQHSENPGNGKAAMAQAFKVVNSGDVTRKVVLHDGSTIILEPGSEIRYAEKFGNQREVYLSGDAFFEVTKDASRPFLVYANEITTKVLGTSFRIKANQGEKEIVVAVKTGKVSVFAKSNSNDVLHKTVQEITLTPNQQAIYKRNEHVVLKKIVEEPQVITGQPTLKDSYVNEPVVLILKALSESYGVDIRFDKESLSDCTLTSDIIEGEGLYDQLEIVCNALGGTYKIEHDASIVIEASGCRTLRVKP
jgi:transmembrane sensor